jgi:hypothetical protein
MLWQRLLNPASHPLYWQLHQEPSHSERLSRLGWPSFIIAPLLCCGLWYCLMTLKATVISPLSIIVLFVSSSLYVSVWIIDITQMIIREHRQGTYDLLCAAPAGAINVNQAICAASLHRYNALMWINLARKLSAGLFLFVLLMIFPLAAFYQKPDEDLRLWRPFLDIVALIIATYLDHVQTVVLGCLVAMLAPVQRPRNRDASLIAVGGFLTVQALIFLLTGLVITLLDLVYEWFHPTSVWVELCRPALNLLAFYLIRETFNIILWKELVAQLEASPAEFQVSS